MGHKRPQSTSLDALFPGRGSRPSTCPRQRAFRVVHRVSPAAWNHGLPVVRMIWCTLGPPALSRVHGPHLSPRFGPWVRATSIPLPPALYAFSVGEMHHGRATLHAKGGVLLHGPTARLAHDRLALPELPKRPPGRGLLSRLRFAAFSPGGRLDYLAHLCRECPLKRRSEL